MTETATIQQIRERQPNVTVRWQGEIYTAQTRGKHECYATVSWQTAPTDDILYATYPWETITNTVNSGEPLKPTEDIT